MVKNSDEYNLEIKRLMDTCRIIEERIAECSSIGHIKPNLEENWCNYCSQRLEYSTPQTDAILSERQKLPWVSHSYDAPFIRETRRKEIDAQKSLDRLKGIEKLMSLKGLKISFQ